jgi:hypothetical protein
MINNFDKIKTMLSFDSDEDYYFIQLIRNEYYLHYWYTNLLFTSYIVMFKNTNILFSRPYSNMTKNNDEVLTVHYLKEYFIDYVTNYHNSINQKYDS